MAHGSTARFCELMAASSDLGLDPSQDGAETVNGVADRVRAETYRRIGLEDLLSPRIN
jgi:hypothetical protein